MTEKSLLIDRKVLRREMYSRGITAADLARILGRSKVQTYKKLSGDATFDECELSSMLRVFGASIFFALPISQNAKGDKGR